VASGSSIAITLRYTTIRIVNTINTVAISMKCWSSAPVEVRSSIVAAGPTTLAVSVVFAVVSLTIWTTFRYATCPSPVPITPTMFTGSCQALLSVLWRACFSSGIAMKSCVPTTLDLSAWSLSTSVL
jgi:hypothetical protein